ncbi:MAG: hypothetical protein ACTSQY_09385 [Candidatus Odinarchaeia archaeon]
MVIEGKVIRIISPSEVLVNVGEENGVTQGMEFTIYESGEEIFDPETEESLGCIEYKKADVIVKNTQLKMSTLKAKNMTYPNLTYTGLDVLLTITRSMYSTTEGKLPVDEESINPIAPPTEKLVQIGDLVRQRISKQGEDNLVKEAS